MNGPVACNFRNVVAEVVIVYDVSTESSFVQGDTDERCCIDILKWSMQLALYRKFN